MKTGKVNVAKRKGKTQQRWENGNTRKERKSMKIGKVSEIKKKYLLGMVLSSISLYYQIHSSAKLIPSPQD